MCKASATLLHRVKKSKAKNWGRGVVTVLANDTTHIINTCYRTCRAKRDVKLNHNWPVGLVVWFSLRVREVPGSPAGQAPSLLFCQNVLQAVTESIFLVFFSAGFLDAKKLKDWAKEEKQRQEAKKILYFHAKALLCVELWNSPFNLFNFFFPCIKSSLNIF